MKYTIQEWECEACGYRWVASDSTGCSYCGSGHIKSRDTKRKE
ncbi:MAG: hypothetical protein QXL94_00210 [Candidatus Parvarchaeum sp.]